MPEDVDPPDDEVVAADNDDLAARSVKEAPLPLVRDDLGGGRSRLVNDRIGLLVLLAAVSLMVGFLLGRLSAPESAEEIPPTTLPSVAYPSGDVDRSGYWAFAGITPVVTDSFERPDARGLGSADTGEEWDAPSGSWVVTGGQAAAADGRAGPSLAVIDGGNPNRLTEATLMVVETGAGIVFRYRDPQNYWSMTADTTAGNWVITRVLDGEADIVAAVPGPMVDGTAVGVAQIGPALQVLVDGQELRRLSDAVLSAQTRSGLIGPPGSPGTARWDRFYVGDMPAPG